MEIQKLLQWAGITIVILIILGYSIFAFKGILWGPEIILNAELNGSATTTPLITIAGHVIRTADLSLNGATTTLDLAGNFSESLLLSSGYNIITLEGFGKYGRKARRTIEMTLVGEATKISTSTATSTITNSKE